MLYANKNCAEQLRADRKVSVEIVSREHLHGLFLATVRARTPDGPEASSAARPAGPNEEFSQAKRPAGE